MKWIVFLCLLAVYSVQAMPSQEEEEQAVESNNEEEEGVDGVKSRNKRSYRVDDGPHPEPSGLDLDVNVNVNVPGSNNDVDVNVNVNAGYINWENGPSDGEDSESEATGEEKSTEGSISNSSDWSGGDGSGAECSTRSRNGCDTASATDCVWKQAEYDFEFAPLLLYSSFQMVLPIRENKKNIVRVPADTELTIACPGGNIGNLSLEVVNGTCAGNTLINVNGTNYTMADLNCSVEVQSSIQQENDQGICGALENGVNRIIGFNITTATTSEFYEVIRVCFNPEKETTIYTINTIHGANFAATVGREETNFKPNCFSSNISELYKIEWQEKQMKKLLNSTDKIDKDKKLYLNKGHMAPVGDFVTKDEKIATYYFINAVPQWEIFNGGNWKKLEESIRNLAKFRLTDLTIYTGTFEVLKLKDEGNVSVDIYLGSYKEKPVVPAPKLMWKVVHDKKKNQAVALVGVNNPYIENAPEHLCDVMDCKSIDWLKFGDFKGLLEGYTYCCTVQSLKDNISNIPDLGDVKLLDKKIKKHSSRMESLG